MAEVSPRAQERLVSRAEPAAREPRLTRAYHMPHNVAFPDEFHLLVRVLSFHGAQNFRQLTARFLEMQIRSDAFRLFHPKPHEYFTNPDTPSDLRSIAARLGSEKDATVFAHSRARLYNAFVSGEVSIEDLLDGEYKPGRAWRQVWVEYARDYLDFTVLLGLAEGSSTTSCELRERGHRYLADPTVLDEALLSFTVSLRRGDQTHSIRPFWLTLMVLSQAHRNGTYAVPVRRLMSMISHLAGDDRLGDGVREVLAGPGEESKEAQRFSLPVRRFLESRGLAQESRKGGQLCLCITRKGRLVVEASLR